jgi:fibronectin type 3 domain-containing protein
MDSGLDNNATYYYQVTAKDKSGKVSLASAEVWLYPSDEVAPQSITYLAASDGGSDQGNGKITLNWTLSPDDGSGENDVSEYHVFRSTYDGNYVLVEDSLPSGTSTYNDTTGLDIGATYYFKVKAFDGANLSTSPVQSTATVDNIAPQAPQNLIANAGDGLITLSWDSNPETDVLKYDIYRDSGPGWGYLTFVSTTATIHEDNGLTNNVTYSYRITARDIYTNESSTSAVVSTYPFSGADITPPAAISMILHTLILRTGTL